MADSIQQCDLDLDQTFNTELQTTSSPSHPAQIAVLVWSKPLWVLIYIFSYSVSPAATNDKAEWRLGPSVVFQEFSSEERCKDAKSKIEGTLKHAGDRLRSGLADLQKAG